MESVTDEKLEPIFLLYHEFDNDYLMLKGMDLNKIEEIINKEKVKIYKEHIEKIDETNMYSIGKILLHIHGIEDFPYPGSIVTVNINLSPFIVKTKETSENPAQNYCEINQQFLM